MKHVALFILFVCPLLVMGQPERPIVLDFPIFRGNVGVSPLISLLPADTSKAIVISVREKFSSKPVSPQPTLVRTGLYLTIRFATSTDLPALSTYELTIGGQTRFAGTITTNKEAIVFPTPSGSILSGIYSQLGILQGLINNIGSGGGTGGVPVGVFNSFVAATSATLTQHTTDIASRVPIADYNAFKTNNALNLSGINSGLALRLPISDTVNFQRKLSGYGLYPNADKIKLAGISPGATNVDSTLLVPKSTYALDKAAQAAILGSKLTQTQADGLYKPLNYVPAWNEIQFKPGLFPPSSHTHVGSDIATDATHRFVTDTQIANWNSLSGSGFSGRYPDLLEKPDIPTSASQVGAVALSDYNNDKSAQGLINNAQSTSIANLNTNKLDASTYTTNRAADLSTVSSVSSTANAALSTSNSATATSAINSTSIVNLQTGKLDLSIYTSYTATVAIVLAGKLDASTYATNRSADQAATTTAQNTANTALSTANSATATGASNASAITANKAAADAHIANTNNPHGVTTTQIGAVPIGQYNTDKAAQGVLDAAQSTSIASNTSAIVLASPRSFTSYAAANAASTTATVPQTWVVTADETTLDKNGNPIRVTYWFDGVTLLTAPYFKADGTPIGSTSTTLNGYYLKVTVPNKDAANAAATGSQAKIITVTTDDSDGNRTNKYIYDGDNQPLGNPLF